MRPQIARRVVLAGLVALGLTLTCTTLSAVAAPTPQESLPLPAQATISGVLGRDTAAYHATAHGAGLQLTNPRHGSPAGAQAPLLQFRSQGHILGFAEDRLYTVGMGYALIEEFVGAHKVRPQAAEPTSPAPTTTPAAAPPLQAVTYPQLWDGITVSYTTTASGLAMSTYRIAPHADPGRIRLRYNTDVAVQPDGSLRLQHPTEKRYFTLSAPRAWQERAGRRVPVSVAFTHPAARDVGFTVGRYDPTAPLLIDPTYAWHTFYGSGSASEDEGNGIAVDGSGNVYVTGSSYAGWGTPLNPHSGSDNADIVVLKLDSAGALQWHTFYGSTGHDEGNGIAVDGSGNVYVTGSSYAGWGTPLNPHNADIVVLKLDSAGALQWHTFYGSAEYDEGNGIAVDGSGNVYVTGSSYAGWGTPLNPYSGGPDIVVLKLDSAGALQWHTFYGSADHDAGNGIAVDGSGNVYVTGNSSAGWGTPLNPHSEGWDTVVLKLDSAGALQWHTFYGPGPAGIDVGLGIAVDGSGNVYVTGNSSAGWGTPLNPHSGGFHDIVVLKLTSAGAYQWHTFYGSARDDNGQGIAVDGSGNVYVTGNSDATWGTPLNPHNSGGRDIVVLKLDSAGALQWHTFYGSTDHDEGFGIAVDGSGSNVYVTGGSYTGWGTPLNPHSGGRNIVVLKLSGVADTTPPTTTASPSPAPNLNGWNNTNVTVNLNATDEAGGSGVKEIEFTLTGAQGGGSVVGGSVASVTIATEGITTLTYFARDNAGNQETAKTLTVQIDKTPPTVTATQTPAPNANGWNNTDVTVAGNGTDSLSGIASCTSTTLTTEGAGQSATVSCTDKAGNSASAAKVVNLDKTPPFVTFGASSPAPNAAGWNNTDVSIPFIAGDSLSGVASVSPASPLILTAEGPAVTGVVTVTDNAGNSAIVTSPAVKIDKTPPTVACSVNPITLWPPNHKMVGVTAAVAVTDPLSGPAGFTLTSATSSEPDNGVGDGDTPNDIQGFDLGAPDTSGLLRAERSGNSTGRVYTLTYKGMDLAGNSATCRVTVTVPHDKK